MTSSPSRLSSSAVLALTIASLFLLALAPAQLVLRKAIGSEPYPQLMMPSFGSHDARSDEVASPVLRLVGVRADGTERELDIPALLPRSQTLPMIIAHIQFSRPEVITQPESVAWLTRRIHDAYPDERFDSLQVLWSQQTIQIGSGTLSSRPDREKSYTVELRSDAKDDR
jgi:hypothetical protein